MSSSHSKMILQRKWLMPRKKKSVDEQEAKFERTPDVVESPLEEILADRFSRYSKYIIQERALPDARDGLKPVQRRILWAMFEDGNTYNKPYRKSAKTVGNVIGNYHPHGDSSVYDALVRLSQNWKIRLPLIDMQGNNGSIDDDPAAAMRYTEARLSRISNYLMEDMDKDTVEWSPNFSDDKMEPTVFPARYPNLLVNGITGIAAGYATNIPPHNLNEVIEGTIYRIEHPDSTLDDLMKIVKGPDFPTGAIAMGADGIRQAFETGRGKLFIRSKAEIAESKTMQQIIITEIPYEVIKSNLVRRMDDIRFDKKVDGILDIRDESDRKGLRIVVDLKKEANAQAILNYLYKNTDLQISYNYNVVAIVNKAPKLMGLLDILDAFIAFREEVVLRRSRYDYARKEARAHIIEGLIKAVSVLDEVIQIIRGSKNKADSKKRLSERFGFTEPQVEAIVTLQLYRLSNTDIKELQAEGDALQKEMKFLKGIIENRNKRHKLMISELKDMNAQFETPRLTQLVDEKAEIVIDEKAMIANEQVFVTVSKDGYLKRVSMRSYTSGSAGGSFTGLKEGDRIEAMGTASTLNNLLVVTSSGKMGMIPVYTLPEAKWKDMGVHLSSFLRTDAPEKIVSAWLYDEIPEKLQFILLTRYGQIKRLTSADFPKQKGARPAVLMNLTPGDEVIGMQPVQDENTEIILSSLHGYGLRYKAAQIPSSSARSKGVRGMSLEDKDSATVIACRSGDCFVIEFDNGGFKRLDAEEILCPKTRPAKGVLLYKKTKTSQAEICDGITGAVGQNIDLLLDKPVELKISSLKKMDLKQSYAQPFKDQLEEGRLPEIIRPLEMLPAGNWKEEKQPEPLSLFDHESN